ncbi:TPA: UbiX family flavin prenyltransferase [Pluralibacter gergoviae]
MSGKAAKRRRVIVGISGASGFSYGVQVLRLLRLLEVESHLVISAAGHLNREHETDLSADDVAAMADEVYPIRAVGAAIASGSFRIDGMVVAPCSMHTLAAIANGLTDNLLTRAADVVLKERRRLVLMVRETPLHAGHLRNMQYVTEAGAIVFPPVPAMYARPQSVEEIVSHSAARALGLLGLDCEELPRWGETLTLTRGRNES